MILVHIDVTETFFTCKTLLSIALNSFNEETSCLRLMSGWEGGGQNDSALLGT